MRRPPITPAPTMPRSIRRDEVLPLSEAARRLGWGVKTTRHAEREGLRVVQFGRAKYTTGAAVFDFFAGRMEEEGTP